MKTPLRKRSAFVAWAASVPLALAIPAVVWWISGTVVDGSFKNMRGAFYVIGFATVVHLAGYLITGLPIFLIKFKSPESNIWYLQVSLAAGTLIGAGVAFFILTPLDGTSLTDIALACLICAGYGFATPIGAWFQRPNLQTP